MDKQNTQKLAEQIALLLQSGHPGNSGDDSLRAALEKINQRLDSIESQMTPANPPSQIADRKPTHASQEKFKSLEALADEIIGALENEKACPYEPTGKPCDHCSMCSSRGF